MPQTCTICRHPERAAIEKALTHTALVRHKAHIAQSLVKAQESREVAHGDNVLEQLETLHASVLKVLERAESLGNLRLVLGAVREARSNLEFLADLLTKLKGASQGPTIVTLEDGIVGSYKTREEAERDVEKAREILGDARVDEILAEMAVRKAQRRLAPPAVEGSGAAQPPPSVLSPSGHRSPDPPPPPAPHRRWMTAEEAEAEADRLEERLRGRAALMGPRDFGPPEG